MLLLVDEQLIRKGWSSCVKDRWVVRLLHKIEQVVLFIDIVFIESHNGTYVTHRLAPLLLLKPFHHNPTVIVFMVVLGRRSLRRVIANRGRILPSSHRGIGTAHGLHAGREKRYIAI